MGINQQSQIMENDPKLCKNPFRHRKIAITISLFDDMEIFSSQKDETDQSKPAEDEQDLDHRPVQKSAFPSEETNLVQNNKDGEHQSIFLREDR